jgi:hypothetical protein
MIIGNLRSHADLQKKKSLANDLLELEIANEAENQKRIRDYKSPYVAKPVPPVYKTQAELRKDKDNLILEARNKLSSLNLDQSIISTLLNTYLTGSVDDLVKFNAFFPSIRNKFQRSINPDFASAEAVWDIIKLVFAEISDAYGMKFSGGIRFTKLDDIEDNLDIRSELDALIRSEIMQEALLNEPKLAKEA